MMFRRLRLWLFERELTRKIEDPSGPEKRIAHWRYKQELRQKPRVIPLRPISDYDRKTNFGQH